MALAVYRGENAGGIDVKKVYVVDLTKEEKSELLKLVGKGEVRARKMNRAHILLLADEDRTDKDIAQALHTSPSTVERTRRRLVEGGVEHALNESARPGGRRKLTGKQEAYVWWLWPAPILRRARSAGACRCSPINSWSSK